MLKRNSKSQVPAPGTFLFGQQASTQPETVPLKTVPVMFDSAEGAAIARFGEGKYGQGRLHPMHATLLEIPPGGKLPPHRHLAEEMIHYYIVSGNGHANMGTGSGGQASPFSWRPRIRFHGLFDGWMASGDKSYGISSTSRG